MISKQLKFISKGIFILVFIIANACSSSDHSNGNDTSSNVNSDGLKVYAFHGTRQCETCKNMKKYTKATLDKYFKEELKSGEIVYQVVDVDDEANYKLAEKFEATGTALMINKVKNGKDQIEDWSEFAFEFAPGEQAEFEAEFKQMVEAKLK